MGKTSIHELMAKKYSGIQYVKIDDPIINKSFYCRCENGNNIHSQTYRDETNTYIRLFMINYRSGKCSASGWPVFPASIAQFDFFDKNEILEKRILLWIDNRSGTSFQNIEELRASLGDPKEVLTVDRETFLYEIKKDQEYLFVRLERSGKVRIQIRARFGVPK